MSQLFLPFMFSENMAQSRLCSDDPSAALSQRTQSLQTQPFEMRSVNALNESASQLAGQLMQGLRAIRRKRSRSLPTLAESPSPRVEQSNQQLELSASSTKSAGRLHVRFERGNNVNDDETPQEDDTDALAPLPAIKYRSQSARVSMQLEEDPALPELIGGTLTDILSRPKYATTLVPKLEACLPSYHRGYDWKLLYSLGQHGCSLHTLLTKVQDEAPTLVVVETARGDVFGGFTTVAWHSATSYYGVGESFVFSNQPRFEFFRWSRWDTMLMLSNDQSIAMGGGGEFAWYMNSDLSCGTSGASTTFKNRCLTSEPDFDIVSVEVWGFTTKR